MKVYGGMAAAASVAVLMAACGGGGGGGGTGGTVPEAPDTSSPGPDAATLYIFREQTGKALQVASQSTAMGAQLLGLAQFGIDAAHRLATPGGPQRVTATCARTGTVTLTLTDRDGNGRATAGDLITAVLDNCGMPVLMRTATGSVQVELIAGSAPTLASDTQVRITVGAGGLALSRSLYVAGLYDLPPATLTGSLVAQWGSSETGQQLRALSTAADDVRLASTAVGVPHTDTVRKIDVTRTVRHDLASAGTAMAFVYEMGELGGRVVVGSAQPLGGRANATPSVGVVSIGLAGGQSLRVQPVQDFGPARMQASLLTTSSGGTVASAALGWRSDHAALAWDGRQPVASGYPVLDGFSGDDVEIAPDTYPSPTSELDALTNQNPVAGVSTFRADALFLHPVLPAAGSASAALAVRWQSGQALADAQPAFRFRFVVDPSSTLGGIEDPPEVAATAVRTGALYVIRPAESLRHGARYWLQASPDGVDWTSSITRTLADGSKSLIGATLASFGTPATLVAGIAAGDRAVPAATRPATLQATTTLGSGQAVASYQWTQLSGPPVTIAAPMAATTTVGYADSAPRSAAPVVLQLTVTDTLGEVERIRTELMVGDTLPGAGVLLYVDSRTSPTFGRKTMGLAAGGVELTSEPGKLALRFLQPVAGTGSTTFELAPADGLPLRVGRYDNAVPSHVAGLQNGIEGLLLRDDCVGSVSGSFNVQDVAFAANGAVLRLAVDVQQSCQGFAGLRTNVVSYRFNSSIAIRP